ncbi:MAG: glycosyltransferase family 39 protein [Ferruginibacter sp.]
MKQNDTKHEIINGHSSLLQAGPVKKNVLLLFFILLKSGIHFFLINKAYNLHRDEYLHLDQAKHLAWGYESVPPFTSWISWLILQLGNSVFWIKFFPVLFGVLTMVVVWKAIEALKGGLFALILGALAIIFSVIMRINILYQPNSFDILCWTFFYFSLLKYINTENNKWLWIAAVTFAFGFLNKYNIGFLIIGLLPAILLTPHRKILLNKQFYFAVLLALLLISPNLVWQYQNNFPVVHHMKELADTQLVNVQRLDFIREQLLFFAGSVFTLIAAFAAFIIYRPFTQYRVFALAYIFTILIFLYFKAKPYYAIGCYPTLLSFGVVYLEQVLMKGWKFYVRPVLIFLLLGLFIPVMKIIFPISTPEKIAADNGKFKKLGMLKWEDGNEHTLPQDFADMLGWDELAHKVDSIYETVANKTNTLVLCDNYGQAGAINYYTHNKDLHAVSLNADYINWFPLKTQKITNLILVNEAGNNVTEEIEKHQLFRSIKLVGTIENYYAREKGTNIFLLLDAMTPINKILQDKINKVKASW